MESSSFNISIPKEAIAELETLTYPYPITIVDTVEAADAAVNELMQEAVVGFDTETKPSFKKGRNNPVALMQVSTHSRTFLFRLNKIGLTASLIAFMESDSVKKIGLSLKDDFFVMHRSGAFEPQGFVDLQSFVRDFNIIDCSLQRIYAIIFGKRISKSQRLSNWEAPALTRSQQAYASIDAWACLQIYDYLTEGLFDPASSPYIVKEEPQE